VGRATKSCPERSCAVSGAFWRAFLRVNVARFAANLVSGSIEVKRGSVLMDVGVSRCVRAGS
jgi:hypothetical protein